MEPRIRNPSPFVVERILIYGAMLWVLLVIINVVLGEMLDPDHGTGGVTDG